MKKIFTFAGQSLPINPDSSDFLPEISHFVDEALEPDNIAGIMAAIRFGYPVLLEGPTGSGKTSVIRWLARQTNNSYRRIQLNGSTTIENFVGKYLLSSEGTYWIDGILTDAMRKGHWLLLDEINAALPEVLFVINSILDDDRALILDQKEDREVVTPHPNFRLFAAMNPWQDYAGTKEMNKSQLDRFVKFQYDYLGEADESKIVAEQAGIAESLGQDDRHDDPLALRMVKIANIIRRMEANAEITAVCSTRQLIQWAKMCHALDIKKAARFTLLNKYDAEERQLIANEIDKFFADGESFATYQKQQSRESHHSRAAALAKSCYIDTDIARQKAAV